jgi:hypothetical protein
MKTRRPEKSISVNIMHHMKTGQLEHTLRTGT